MSQPWTAYCPASFGPHTEDLEFCLECGARREIINLDSPASQVSPIAIYPKDPNTTPTHTVSRASNHIRAAAQERELVNTRMRNQQGRPNAGSIAISSRNTMAARTPTVFDLQIVLIIEEYESELGKKFDARQVLRRYSLGTYDLAIIGYTNHLFYLATLKARQADIPVYDTKEPERDPLLHWFRTEFPHICPQRYRDTFVDNVKDQDITFGTGGLPTVGGKCPGTTLLGYPFRTGIIQKFSHITQYLIPSGTTANQDGWIIHIVREEATSSYDSPQQPKPSRNQLPTKKKPRALSSAAESSKRRKIQASAVCTPCKKVIFY